MIIKERPEGGNKCERRGAKDRMTGVNIIEVHYAYRWKQHSETH
jgi:hypothetical protein